METWTSLRLASNTPIARTSGRPPEDSRTATAMAFARATSSDSSTALKATSGVRTPLRALHPLRQLLETAATHQGELATIRGGCCLAVKKHRNARLLRESPAYATRRRDGAIHY